MHGRGQLRPLHGGAFFAGGARFGAFFGGGDLPFFGGGALPFFGGGAFFLGGGALPLLGGGAFLTGAFFTGALPFFGGGDLPGQFGPLHGLGQLGPLHFGGFRRLASSESSTVPSVLFTALAITVVVRHPNRAAESNFIFMKDGPFYLTKY